MEKSNDLAITTVKCAIEKYGKNAVNYPPVCVSVAPYVKLFAPCDEAPANANEVVFISYVWNIASQVYPGETYTNLYGGAQYTIEIVDAVAYSNWASFPTNGYIKFKVISGVFPYNGFSYMGGGVGNSFGIVSTYQCISFLRYPFGGLGIDTDNSNNFVSNSPTNGLRVGDYSGFRKERIFGDTSTGDNENVEFGYTKRYYGAMSVMDSVTNDVEIASIAIGRIDNKWSSALRACPQYASAQMSFDSGGNAVNIKTPDVEGVLDNTPYCVAVVLDSVDWVLYHYVDGELKGQVNLPDIKERQGLEIGVNNNIWKTAFGAFSFQDGALNGSATVGPVDTYGILFFEFDEMPSNFIEGMNEFKDNMMNGPKQLPVIWMNK